MQDILNLGNAAMIGGGLLIVALLMNTFMKTTPKKGRKYNWDELVKFEERD